MATTAASLGYGSKLYFELTDGALDWSEIEEAQDLPEVGQTFGEIDATHQGSPTSTLGDGRTVGAMEFIADLIDPETQTFSFHWIKSATQEAVRNAVGTKRNFQLRYSAAPTVTTTMTISNAFIKSAKVTAPVRGKKMLMVTLRFGTTTES